jgi:hypothetical protein
MKLISIIVFVVDGRDLNSLCFGAVFRTIKKGHVIFGRTRLQQKRRKLKNS